MFRLTIWGQNHGCSLTSCQTNRVSSTAKSIPIHLTSPSHRIAHSEHYANLTNLSIVKPDSCSERLAPNTGVTSTPGEPVRAEPVTSVPGAALSVARMSYPQPQCPMPLHTGSQGDQLNTQHQGSMSAAIAIPLTPKAPPVQHKELDLCLLNVRSVGDAGKTNATNGYIS